MCDLDWLAGSAPRQPPRSQRWRTHAARGGVPGANARAGGGRSRAAAAARRSAVAHADAGGTAGRRASGARAGRGQRVGLRPLAGGGAGRRRARAGRTTVGGERELRAFERLEARPLASAEVGLAADGSPARHRPDLVCWASVKPMRDRGRADREGAREARGDRARMGPQPAYRRGRLLRDARRRAGAGAGRAQ